VSGKQITEAGGRIRMSLPRFRLRTLMIAVAVVAVLLCLPPVWDSSYVSLGIGSVNVPLLFVVCDGESRQPIEGATIRLQDPDCIDTPIAPYVLGLKTAAGGRADLPLNLTFTNAVSPSGRLLSFHVRYPNWEMRVSAPGYREFQADFAMYQKGNPRYHSNLPPPPIVIGLRRQ
jgi:hypothetical protein